MTPFKNFTHHTAPTFSWKNRARRGGLYVAVAALLSVHASSCGSGDNGQDWEEVTVQEPTKGVVTTIEETEAGKFAITDEQVVPSKDSSRVVIKRLDGTTETLSIEQARRLVQPQDTAGTHNTTHTSIVHHHHSGGLGGVLWWGAMGYMMGRNMNTPVNPGIYRDDRRGGFSGGGGGYAGGAAYRAGNSAASELQRTAVSRTTMRPVSGKSGFFGGSSRSRASS
jgi:hypothetical protein